MLARPAVMSLGRGIGQINELEDIASDLSFITL
ncbi:hypothetical protein Vi05172_g13633 [Venturia inaequalis]|nr:hypothetical protein Vi05172_g13633 [Venturia inaequalis]